MPAIHVAKVDERAPAGEFIYVDGKARSQERIDKDKELEGLLGLGMFNPYGTVIEETFEEMLKTSTLAELQAIARRGGLNPYANNRHELIPLMRRDFARYKRSNLDAPAQMLRPAKGAAEIAAIYEGVEKKK